MIKLEKVEKEYDENFRALNGVSLEIPDGQLVAVVGKSGSGKSTLLNMIGSLDKVTSGSIFIDGEDITKFNDRQLAEFRREKLGFIFQSFYLEPEYTVFDNVRLPFILSDDFSAASKQKVMEALESTGMAEKAHKKAKTLSGGEQQRTAIARALVHNPRYILADEPCGNLDSANSQNVMELLKAMHKSGKTVIMVTHDISDAHVAERIITMKDGVVFGDEEVAVADRQ